MHAARRRKKTNGRDVMISLKLPPALLKELDHEAHGLMSRSAYIRWIFKNRPRMRLRAVSNA